MRPESLNLMNSHNLPPRKRIVFSAFIPARNVDTNRHIEVKCFNLLKPDGAIPLGICKSTIRFRQKLHYRSVGGAFFMASLENDTWC